MNVYGFILSAHFMRLGYPSLRMLWARVFFGACVCVYVCWLVVGTRGIELVHLRTSLLVNSRCRRVDDNDMMAMKRAGAFMLMCFRVGGIYPVGVLRLCLRCDAFAPARKS